MPKSLRSKFDLITGALHPLYAHPVQVGEQRLRGQIEGLLLPQPLQENDPLVLGPIGKPRDGASTLGLRLAKVVSHSDEVTEKRITEAVSPTIAIT